ncbi:MAG: M23 family metallopeptidase [Acidimicrobiia bacterium]
MKGSLSAALVAVLLLLTVPAASADDEPPPEPPTTTTTTTTTTIPDATTTTTTSTTTTTTPPPTTTLPPVLTDPPPVDPPSAGPPPPVEPPPAEPPAVEPPVDDVVADVDDPFVVPGVPKNQIRRVDVTRKIVFPLVGINYYRPGFGACRDYCEREHHGIDIMTYGWKGVPVVAAHDGRIRTIRDDGEWCNIEITGRDRWYTRYIHLNNDTPGYDDASYECVVPGIEVGTRVEAGQIIGWVGDSGNAEFTPPHLHFEIRMPSGLPVDPYKSLKAAKRIRYQRTLGDDSVASAAQIASYAYSGGSSVVNIMAKADYELFQAGGFTTLDLSVPLLLAEADYLPQATLDALDLFNPSRVIIVGDGLRQSVVDQLALRFPIVARTAMPARHPDPIDEPFAGFEIEEPEDLPAPFSVIFVGDRSDLPEAFEFDLARWSRRMPTAIFDAAEPGRYFGLDIYRGPGRSGNRNTLYYSTGNEYTRFPAKEPPETPPDYGVLVFDTKRTSEATVTFLNSLADLPVVPLWR